MTWIKEVGLESNLDLDLFFIIQKTLNKKFTN